MEALRETRFDFEKQETRAATPSPSEKYRYDVTRDVRVKNNSEAYNEEMPYLTSRSNVIFYCKPHIGLYKFEISACVLMLLKETFSVEM